MYLFEFFSSLFSLREMTNKLMFHFMNKHKRKQQKQKQIDVSFQEQTQNKTTKETFIFTKKGCDTGLKLRETF